MNVAEMRRREDYDSVLESTLTTLLSRHLERPVTVRAALPGVHGQVWRFHRLLGAYTVEDAAPVVRRWLRDNFRHTPVRRRRLAQWVLGTAAATPVGLRLDGSPALVVDPPVARARDLAIVPGNQRVRLFDFGAGRTRVELKTGFSPRTMLNEISVRRDDGPWPPLLAYDAEDPCWLEEPLLDAWPLPRCPQWVDRAEAARTARASVNDWAAPQRRPVGAESWVSGKAAAIAEALGEIRARFEVDVSHWIGRLDRLGAEAQALQGAQVSVGPTHGDLQGGNVLVDRRTGQVTVIDWEHSRERWWAYDLFIEGLGARSARGLNKRLARFIDGRVRIDMIGVLGDDVSWRRASLARFLLEDILFHVEEAISGPYKTLPDGLVTLDKELSAWLGRS